MNRLESAVYNLVRKNPAVKQFVRNCYQGAFDLLPKQKEYFLNQPDYREGYFFGFHDVSPWNGDETKLLACCNSFDLRMPKPDEPLVVGYFDFVKGQIGDYHQVCESFAWNYHKGCRLQWLSNNELIFNTAINGRLVSEIIDLETGRHRIVTSPIDATYSDDVSQVATSFSYERLQRCMPGYGYPYSDGGMVEQDAPSDSGLFSVDLQSGNRTMLVSLAEIAAASGQSITDDYLHFVTHTEFSKDGRYISFLYRRIPRHGDYMKRWTQIMVYDRTSRNLSILPTGNSGSHYVWNNRNQLVASCIIEGKSCHALLGIDNGMTRRLIAVDRLNSDGHQSFVGDDAFITDTYPDRRRMARIYRAEIGSNDVQLIASIYSPRQFQTKDFKCHIACDLHPRVSPSGCYVCFDSPRTGKRGLYVMAL